jgi:hypothetical protein
MGPARSSRRLRGPMTARKRRPPLPHHPAVPEDEDDLATHPYRPAERPRDIRAPQFTEDRSPPPRVAREGERCTSPMSFRSFSAAIMTGIWVDGSPRWGKSREARRVPGRPRATPDMPKSGSDGSMALEMESGAGARSPRPTRSPPPAKPELSESVGPSGGLRTLKTTEFQGSRDRQRAS